MKKFICASLVGLTLLTGSHIKPKAETITNFKGQQAQVFTSADAQESSTGAKSSISVSFIEDPQNSDLIALVSIKGFIPSGLIRRGDYYWGELVWPSKYGVVVTTSDSENQVKVLESIPRNRIETVRVTETMGYTIGGNISANKDAASGSTNASFNVSRSVAYDQQDFRTTQRSDSLNQASWEVEFNATRDGYDRSSYNILYGNQLFMKTRLQNEGRFNLTEDKDLSSLISGGFSPNMVIALKAPKGTEKSNLSIDFQRSLDTYRIDWSTTQWFGTNNAASQPESNIHNYELNWKEHTIRKS